MGKIKVLTDNVANKIAAGEVVDRPESIIKELIENSLDAGADTIKIFLKDGGKRTITIIDNGCGMDFDDAMLAFERHATSKIRSEKDLETISSLGFRGEALPSIASVSKLTLTTSTGGEKGTFCIIEGGVFKKVEKCHADKGTTIEISSLFYNVPARRKFLKSVETEYSRIVRVVNSYALANPDTSFTLTHNGKKTISFTKRHSLEDRVKQVLGQNFTFSEIHKEGISIKCFLMPPEQALKSSSKQFFLLNNRFVKEKTISSSLLSAYKTTTSFFSGYPQAVIWMIISNEMVDVNVHPSKLEVRFRNQSVIYSQVKECCISALSSRKHTPSIHSTHNRQRYTLNPGNIIEPDKAAFVLEQLNAENSSSYSDNVDINFAVSNNTSNFENSTIQQQIHSASHNTSKHFRIIGQFDNSYILLEMDKELFIVDQHVAHERILYEKNLKHIQNGSVDRHRLLIPEIVNIGNEALPLILEKIDIIKSSGFELEPEGDHSVRITSCPIIVKGNEIQKTFLDLVSYIIDHRENDIEEIHKDVAAMIGCKAAIKINHSLSHMEMNQLIEEMWQTDNPYYCPHGRPIIIKLSLYEIEKLFKRK